MSLMKAHNKNHHDVTKSLITEGIVKKVAYYHCSAATVAAGKTNTEVVMLHGAKFTKEDWKTSGILEKLCLSRSVVALDFGVHMSGDDLGKVLSGLESKSILSGKPVALVSPSAGGKAVLDLAAHKSEAKKKYIHSWIPVAVGAVHSASTETLEVFKEIPVLAVYGSRDSGGKKTSMRLEEIANAEVVELEGGHPCYLDSPDAFVKTETAFLGKRQKKNEHPRLNSAGANSTCHGQKGEFLDKEGTNNKKAISHGKRSW
eukprot:CAMPEP_0118702048 /NCGR_PEP_ID=MMETSP0800-20121206/17634_1 /TAXON_ID=210618 ORGANISM="Striatella unipunctata, Strain CCMP2910" /NCGR_SAMPLE_ID=MMETSP0800 /ASSEMBLY_ACC=CAM_ASM_000638 /LENGTH=258 /DNA_ID=CAMNT_0006603125 /DNA_START=143 /DNA_END=920 /DNA_ORIENTATION=+